MKKALVQFKKIILVVVFFTVYTSCETENIGPSGRKTIDVNDRVLNEILALGYSKEEVKDLGTFYVVDEDVIFYKDGVYIQKDKANGKVGQAHNNVWIVYNKQKTITVRVDNSIPTSGIDNWREQVIQACISWNKTNSRIQIAYTTGTSASITVKSDNNILSNNTIAAGAFPSNGNPGAEILINLDFLSNMNVSNATKEYNMVHEIGHNLGLRHTNWSNVDIDQYGNVIPATGIPGTPNVGLNPDPQSVMNGGTALFTWTDFSNFDINGIRRMYPEDNNSNRAYDFDYYIFGNVDLGNLYGNNPSGAQNHWLSAGIGEGRVASPILDINFYRNQYSDLSGMTNVQATTHWVTDGSNEGRTASPTFDVSYYLQNNTDLMLTYGATGFQKGISHYISTGINEGRKACATFDPKMYLQKNPDLAAAYGATNYRKALYHWVAFGRAEGRIAL